MRPLTRRGLQVAAALLTLQLSFALVQACQGRTPSALMPAAGGSLDDLAIQFSRQDGDRFLAVYADLLPSLDPGTRVHVVVSDPVDQEIFEEAAAGWARVPELSFVVADRPITSWARDRLAVLGGGPDDPRATLLVPPAPMIGSEARINDWAVPWDLTTSLPPGSTRVQVADFQFEGGDLIADGEHVFVAPPLLARNPDLPVDDVLDRVARATGLDPVLVGRDKPVPDHHIGMFLTPLGGGRVAVADAELGLAAIGELTHLDVHGVAVPVDRSEARVARFRQVRLDLEAQGFEVVPVPIVPSTERYVMFSYNNALLERRDALRVYMPSYGVPALDDAATRAWTDVGAVVRPIDVGGVFRMGGSVRCLTAPVRRGPTG